MLICLRVFTDLLFLLPAFLFLAFLAKVTKGAVDAVLAPPVVQKGTRLARPSVMAVRTLAWKLYSLISHVIITVLHMPWKWDHGLESDGTVQGRRLHGSGVGRRCVTIPSRVTAAHGEFPRDRP